MQTAQLYDDMGDGYDSAAHCDKKTALGLSIAASMVREAAGGAKRESAASLKKQITPVEVIAHHRWDLRSRRGHYWYTTCLGCDWQGDIRNTGKTALMLHAEHVIDVLLANEVTINA